MHRSENEAAPRGGRLAGGLVLAACLGLAATVVAQPGMESRTASSPDATYAEHFDTFGVHGEPPGWFDSAPGNPRQEARGLFQTLADPVVATNRTFGKESSSVSFSHLRSQTFSGRGGFHFAGRMLRTSASALMGVTFFSNFPSSTRYFLLAQTTASGTIRLSYGPGHSGALSGAVDSGQSLAVNGWYRFRIEAAPTSDGVRVRAKVWRQTAAEPSDWPVDAVSRGSDLDSGWIGLWGGGAGAKHWDDLEAVAAPSDGDDDDRPKIEIMESGAPLREGALFNRTVHPTITTSDDDSSDSVAVSATLDGAPFLSGSAVSAEGLHTLLVTASDESHHSDTVTRHFTIDLSPPRFLSLTPVDGSLTAASSVTLGGEIEGASTITVDAGAVTLTNGRFSAGPFALSEGDRTFLLVAADGAGNQAQAILRITRDSLPPALTIEQPGALARSSPVLVAGSVSDAHLASVTVNERAAVVSGAAYQANGLPLVKGDNLVTVVALDAVGNRTQLQSHVLLDSQAPTVRIRESGADLAEGAVFTRAVTLFIDAVDSGSSGSLTVSALLDGSPFVSGSSVADEGRHSLIVTAADAAGNVGDLVRHFTIDTTPPQFLLVQPAEGSLLASGSVAISGQIRDAGHLTIDGTAVPLAGELFQAGPYTVADGERTFVLVATDAAGNSVSLTLHLTVDTIAPQVAVTSPAPGAAVSTRTISVTGTVSDSRLLDVRVNGLPATVIGASFTSPPIPLTEGDNALSIEARDAANNLAVVHQSVTLDSSPPTISIREGGADLQDGAVFAHAVAPLIEATDATAVHLTATLDGQPFTSGGSIAADGLHELLATASDAAGNVASKRVSFRIDATPPAFEALEPPSGTVSAAVTVVLRGRVHGAQALSIDGQPVTLQGEDFASAPLALREGENTFLLIATGAAGTHTQTAIMIYGDRTPPVLAITQPAEGMLLGPASVNVVGSVSDPHLRAVTVNGVKAAVTGTTFLAPQVPLTEGENALVARADDAANNTSEARRGVVRDSEPPAVAITDPATGTVTSTTTLKVRGSAHDAHLDRVEINGVSATLAGELWSATVGLHEGTNEITARAVDKLGHVSQDAVTVERDSEAPVVSIVTPADGARLSRAAIEVTGSTEPGATVVVNGTVAGVAGSTFTAPSVALVEGENRLVARARDAQGNEGVATRLVTRDTVAPSLLASDPGAGALAVPATALIRLTFSEEMAVPPAAAVRLEAGGQGLGVEVSVAREVLTVHPLAALPPATDLRLALSTAVTDLAGNAVLPVSLSFHTADTAAPAAPVLDPSPVALCGATLRLAGTAEPKARLRVDGGAAAAEATVGSDGHFAVEVPLQTNVRHHLEAVAIDADGNVSAAALRDVINDCTAPFVVDAQLAGGSVRVAFSERVDRTSALDAIAVESEQGAVAGAVSLDAGATVATFVPSAALPAGRFRLTVSPTVVDLAGNPLVASFVKLFGGSSSSSFVVGTLIDDASGRPLLGGSIRVLSTDGVPLPSPQPQATTGSDGAFQLPVAAGTQAMVASRAGYTPVFRSVTTAAGSGAHVLDPRLTPVAPSVAVGPQGGVAVGSDGLQLRVPPGALAVDTRISATGLGEQGLPALLPYGWSPRGAVWIDSAGVPITALSDLRVPVDAPDGTNLVFAALDPATGTWRAMAFVTVTNGIVETSIASAGAFAAVEADAGVNAPPPVVQGEPLGSAPRPGSDALASATVAFDPPTVLPAQTSLATAQYVVNGAQDAPASGLAVTLSVTEELTLLDGSSRSTAPFRTDLLVYHPSSAAASGPRSRFHLRPSAAAGTLPIRLGADDVAVLPYGGESVRGNVLGPDGGEVADAQGDRLELLPTALTEPTAVRIERLSLSQSPLPVPAGTDAVALLVVDVGGRELSQAARLSVATDPLPASGDLGLVLEAVEFGGGLRWRPVVELVVGVPGFVAGTGDLPWPGVTHGGRFLVVRLREAFGFVHGTVLDVGGSALAGALVDSSRADWIQISGTAGAYVLPAPSGTSVIGAQNALTGNGTTVDVNIPADGEIVVDLALQVVAPVVVAVDPADGATDVPPGIDPSVRFSEALDPLSVPAGMSLFAGDAEIPLEFHVQGALVILHPRSTLSPGVEFELRVGGAVRDLQGNGLAMPVAVRFTTRRVLFNKDVDLSKVSLLEPDASGKAHVLGQAGSVPFGTLVFVENISRLAATVSVQAGRDGSFTLDVDAVVSDTLLLHVLLAGSNELVLELTPFLSADGRGAYVDSRAARFVTSQGIAVAVEAGTFDSATLVRVVLSTVESWHAPLVPGEFHAVAGIELSLEGSLAKKGLHVSMPAPAGAPAGGLGSYLLAHVANTSAGPAWMVDDRARLENGRLTTEPPPSTVSAGSRKRAPRNAAAVPQAAAGMLVLPGMFVPGASTRVAFWHVDQPVGWITMPLTAGQFEEIVNQSFDNLVVVVDAALSRILGSLERVSLPARLHRTALISTRDPLTGFERTQATIPGPEAPDQVVDLGKDQLGDHMPPSPVGGSPLRFQVLDLEESANGELTGGVHYSTSNGGLNVIGFAGSVGRSVRVSLLSLDAAPASAAAFTTSGADGAFTLTLPSAGRRALLAVGARIATDDAIDLEFSEALADDLPGIAIQDADGKPVEVDIALLGTRARVRVTPRSGWRAGVTYRLLLTPDLRDPAGNAWGRSLETRFEVEASRPLGTYPLTEVHDLARLGGLLFVAAGQQGLAVLDASDPVHLKNYLPDALTLPFALDAAVRAVAVDAHGRVVVGGGGDTSPGQLKIVDPLRIDRTAIEQDPNRRLDAYVGSTVISNYAGGSIDLPTGTPRRLVVVTDDQRSAWAFGQAVPTGLTVTPPSSADGQETLIVVGGSGFAGHPVTLRNLTRGRFARVDAGAGGLFSIAVKASTGDRLELLANRKSVAYVAIQGSGIAVVDLDAVYHSTGGGHPADVLGIYTGARDPALALCGETLPELGSVLVDMAGLFDPANGHPLTLATLALQRGLVLLESQTLSPGQLHVLSTMCAPAGTGGDHGVVSVVSLPRFGFDLNGDGATSLDELRDYLVVAHASAGLLIYEATDRANPVLVSTIKLPGAVSRVAVDRERGLAYVTAYGAGLYVVNLRGRLANTLVDSDHDGRDDRLLETLAIGDARSLVLVPELGVGLAGGAGKVSALGLGGPRLRAIRTESDSAGATISRLAPLGVPTAPDPDAPAGAAGNAATWPASFVIEASLPGSAGSDVRLDVFGAGPDGEPVQEADTSGQLADLPRAAHQGDDGVLLHREADSILEDGYARYRSDEIAALADLRAARAFTRLAKENEEQACPRCDAAAAGVGATAVEILSGESVAVRWPQGLETELSALYPPEALDRAALEIASTRWETAPSLRQEPELNPALGSGEELGVLLHSGEFTTGAVDLAVKGRGFDFAFARTYRNQTLGNGPLGPGWDFSYHRRLRELPTGDVELYDGRGRRDLFTKDGSGFKSPPGWFVDFQRTAAGFVMVDAAHTVTRFDRFGRLTAVADAVRHSATTGNEMRFFYDPHSRLSRIEDTLARSMTLTYDASGLLTSLRDFDQRELTYAYDAYGRLASVSSPRIIAGESTFPGGLTTRYGYATPGGDLAASLTQRDDLATITDPRGEQWLGLTYGTQVDGRPQAVDSERWGAAVVRLGYDFASRQSTVTDRRGALTTIFLDAAGHATRMEDPAHAVTSVELDGEGLPTLITAPLGRTTAFKYDTTTGRRARGNTLRVTVTPDARGANGSAATLASSAEYEPFSNLPVTTVDPRGTVTTTVRDGAGLPKAIIEGDRTPESGTTRIEYNDFGQPVEVTNPNGHKESLRYFEDGPSRGYLRSRITDPAGLAIESRYETDARGNVTATIDPRGVRDVTEFNEVDWVTARVEAASASQDGASALGYRTSFRHDGNGNVLEEHLPYGETGDAFTVNRRTYGVLNEMLSSEREIEPAGATAMDVSTYDANLNLETATDPEGNTTKQVYDERNLLQSVVRGFGTTDAATETYSFDLEGNRSAVTDGNGHSSGTRYDGYGRVRETIDALGNRSTMAYDNGGNVVASKQFDAAGTLLAESSSDYDRRNRAVAATQTLWDADSTAPRDLVSHTQYDAAGNVVVVTDPRGHATSFAFDAAERRTATQDALGNRSEVQYDVAGHAKQVTLKETTPSGGVESVTSSFTYDAAGRRNTASDALGNTSQTAYDARGNVIREVDPEGNFSVHTFDGLDRRTSSTRPEGIAVTYGYDRASRLVAYADALHNTTAYGYDALSRKTATVYADGARESVAYDHAGNPTERTDSVGTVVEQSFDAGNRLTARVIHPAPGVEGPAAETFAYDGLSRVTAAQSGSIHEDKAYDSLSRLHSATVEGKLQRFAFDDAGNPTAQRYASGLDLARSFDALNRPLTVGSAVTYGYRGSDLVASKTLSNGLSGAMDFDAVRRLTSSSFTAPDGRLAVGEQLAWTPRGQKSGQIRADLNGAGFQHSYDGAGRLTQSTVVAGALPAANQPGGPAPAGAPDVFAFRYDAAENLLEREMKNDRVATSVALPLDSSGRNRPGSAGGKALVWDRNGNLTQKGDVTQSYDYRNRLTRVTRGGDEVVRYAYDSENRRTTRSAAGHIEQTVWTGWQPTEIYRDGVLSERRTYGLGLDEVVKIERDTNGDGTIDMVQIPLYDSTNHLVALTDTGGKPIERYEYTPYGERRILVDSQPPKIVQLRKVGNELWLEASEEVELQDINRALQSGQLTLERTADGSQIPLSASEPVQIGKLARRRVVLTPASPPAAGSEVRVHVDGAALEDTFQNRSSAAYERTFPWPSGDAVLDDTAAPELMQVRLLGAHVEVELSEEADLSLAASAISVDHQSTQWTLAPDRYTLISSDLPSGSHTLDLATLALDLSGQSPSPSYSKQFTIAPGTIQSGKLYEKPDAREVPISAAGNNLGFQGLETDPATGLIYMRNRWYDPELGRFITKDPMGYPDGPNGYAFVKGDPVNGADPMGLYEADFHHGATQYLARLAGYSLDEARLLGEYAEAPDRDNRNPVNAGAVFYMPSSSQDERRAAARVLREWHFPLVDRGHGLEVVPADVGNPEATMKVDQGITSGDLELFGGGLHVLQDSFSHRGVGSRRYADTEVFAEYGHPKARGGLVSHNTDQTWRYPEIAEMAADLTFEKLLDFAVRNRGLPEGRRQQLEDAYYQDKTELRRFLGLETKPKKLMWLQRYGIFLSWAERDDISLPTPYQREDPR